MSWRYKVLHIIFFYYYAFIFHFSFIFNTASGGGDKAVRFWNVITSMPQHTCLGHTHHVLCTTWSPDGNSFVSADRLIYFFLLSSSLLFSAIFFFASPSPLLILFSFFPSFFPSFFSSGLSRFFVFFPNLYICFRILQIRWNQGMGSEDWYSKRAAHEGTQKMGKNDIYQKSVDIYYDIED